MVYRQVRDGLGAGDLHCRESSRFRSFDDDLVDDMTFDRHAELLPRHGLEVAAQPIREQHGRKCTLLVYIDEATGRPMELRIADSKSSYGRSVG